ncbi:MAG: CPBP family intramembrane metalloprotease, partial [Cyclobacteriaceae bacterium]|nr:CPBP family intramembrane metalloprotease [Cyclobacteriaceae bacterium]
MLLALGTLVVFGGVGALLIPYVRDVKFLEFMSGTEKYWLQLTIGILFGIITAKAGWQIIELPKLADTKTFFSKLIKPLKLTIGQIIFISICAGVGEELLFRGAVQPMLGIWITSILFVLLHGYLNPFNLPLTLYGIYMILVIGVMGLMTEYFGILAAMIAHILIDII